jgi:hypothetical protein
MKTALVLIIISLLAGCATAPTSYSVWGCTEGDEACRDERVNNTLFTIFDPLMWIR